MNPSNEEQAYEHLIDLDQLPKPQLNGHMWQQSGNILTCMSCPFTHTTFLSADYQLYGFNEDGSPIIRKVKF
jgi:hypothetical protein